MTTAGPTPAPAAPAPAPAGEPAAPAVAAPAAPPAVPAPAADPRDAAFVQREVALQQKAAQVKSAEAALATQRAQVQRGLDLDAAIKSGDPLKVLQVAGITHEAYTVAQLNAIEASKVAQAAGAKPVTVADLEAHRAKIAADLDAREKAKTDEVTNARKAAAEADARQWEADAQAYIDAHADDLVLTSVRGSGKDLAQLVAEDAYQRAEKDAAGNVVKWPKQLLTVEEAAKKFEASEDAKDAKVAEKRKAKVGASVPVTAPPAAPAAPPAAPAPRALTAELGGTQTGAKPVYRSEAERIQAAIDAGVAARDRK